MDGFIIVDKPAGRTSHDVVNLIRRLVRQKKVGHTGTLDPFATGVLPVALGEATKAIPFLDEGCKKYRGVMKLGESTDTQDYTGNVVGGGDWRSVTHDLLTRVLSGFKGRTRQFPPMYSAIKKNGVPLYRIARRGNEVAREARDIEVYELQVEEVSLPLVVFTVNCSRGTYIRTLANDMGEELGCGAHLIQLQRTASGPFDLGSALSLERLSELASSGELENVVISPLKALGHLHDIEVNESGSKRVSFGVSPLRDDIVSPPEQIEPGTMVRISHSERLISVARVTGECENPFKLLRVFN